MEQRTWAYVVGEADGSFRVGAHRGKDLERHVRTADSGRRGHSNILWAEVFREPRAADAFLRRFRRWPYKRQAQMILADAV